MAGGGRGQGRGRGRKRSRECEYGEAAEGKFQIYHHQSQDYPFSPAFSSRGAALTSPRYSNKPFGSGTVKTPSYSSTLTPTLIITVDDDEDDDQTELHHHGKEKEMDEPSVELISDIKGPPPMGSSSSSRVFDYIHGYRVKAEFAPLLRAIFDKYGNITSGADVKSPDFLSTCLERICQIYQRLEQAKFVHLTPAELQGMISELRLLERRKLSVGWILERAEHIAQTKNSFKDCQPDEARFDALIGRIEKDLEAYEREVCLLQQKISSTKAELLLHKAKYDQTKQGGVDMKLK
ncbi:hypothetical protein AAHA92_04366 [Salvia divinorum]|uniref:Uncharacterized protein n=1 Tax=Salvia divinorum TaxID=28513 RepID=A0ABD1I1H2_SALDI